MQKCTCYLVKSKTFFGFSGFLFLYTVWTDISCVYETDVNKSYECVAKTVYVRYVKSNACEEATSTTLGVVSNTSWHCL